MKPILIFEHTDSNGCIYITKERLETLIETAYEQGKADKNSYGTLSYPTGIRRPGEYEYHKVFTYDSGESNGG